MLVAGAFTMVNAQQVYNLTPGKTHTGRQIQLRPNTLPSNTTRTANPNPSTQTAVSQWVTYADAKDNDWGGGVSELNGNYLFPDSTVLGNFGTYDYIWIHSIGDVFDPTAPTFANFYPGYSMTRSDAYSIDSAAFLYSYARNYSNPNVVDTVIVYLYNNNTASNLSANGFIGTTAANYGTDTVSFKGMKYYGANNMPSSSNTAYAAVAGMQIIKIPLTIADTSVAFWGVKAFSTNNFQVPAGKVSAMAIDFKPGYPYSLGDTVDTQLNSFLFASYEEGGNGASGGSYPIYLDCNYQAQSCDYNCSFISRTQERYNQVGNSWDGYYIPKYAFTQAYSLENHAFSYYIIHYALQDAGNAVMTVYDITGKEVMSFNQGHQAPGSYQLEINTENLQPGVYFYTLNVDGKQATKRMVVGN